MRLAQAIVPWNSAIQSTDRFNDYVGAKNVSGARLVSGGVQAFAYGNAAKLIGAETANSVSTAVSKFGGGDIANGIGYSALAAAEGLATAMLATHAAAAVVTAFDTNAASSALDK